jgi:hypothetical protein
LAENQQPLFNGIEPKRRLAVQRRGAMFVFAVKRTLRDHRQSVS